MEKPREIAFATLDRVKTTLVRSLEEWDDELLFRKPTPDPVAPSK